MYVCMYVCMCIHSYLCVYVYAHTQWPGMSWTACDVSICTGIVAEAGFTQVLRLRPCMPQLDRGRQEGSSAGWGGGYRAPKESLCERGYEVTWRAAGLGDGVPSAQFDSAHTRTTGSSWRYPTRVVQCPRASACMCALPH
jgi:hypothetical protein